MFTLFSQYHPLLNQNFTKVVWFNSEVDLYNNYTLIISKITKLKSFFWKHPKFLIPPPYAKWHSFLLKGCSKRRFPLPTSLTQRFTENCWIHSVKSFTVTGFTREKDSLFAWIEDYPQETELFASKLPTLRFQEFSLHVQKGIRQGNITTYIRYNSLCTDPTSLQSSFPLITLCYHKGHELNQSSSECGFILKRIYAWIPFCSYEHDHRGQPFVESNHQ